MDDRRFDEHVKEFGATRRAALGLLAGVFGTVLGAVPESESVQARKRKRKKKKKDKKRCVPEGGACPASELDCCGLQCCLNIGQPDGGSRFCTSLLNVCCPPSAGGGACSFDFPVCCPNGNCGATVEDCFFGIEGGSGGAAQVARVH